MEVDIIAFENRSLLGLEVKWAENIDEKEAGAIRASANKSLPQLDNFFLLTKKSAYPEKMAVPLSAFLAVMEV